jgi:hypothetical protein
MGPGPKATSPGWVLQSQGASSEDSLQNTPVLELGTHHTHKLKKSFSLMPEMTDAMDRERMEAPKKTWMGFRRLRSHSDAQGRRNTAKPRNHCGCKGGSRCQYCVWPNVHQVIHTPPPPHAAYPPLLLGPSFPTLPTSHQASPTTAPHCGLSVSVTQATRTVCKRLVQSHSPSKPNCPYFSLLPTSPCSWTL